MHSVTEVKGRRRTGSGQAAIRKNRPLANRQPHCNKERIRMNLNTSLHTARARSWATVTLAALLATTAPMAQATLNPYSSGGVNLVQLQNGPLNLAMTADGNLLASFLDGATDKGLFKDSIIAASGGSIGTRTLVRADFKNDGRTTHFGALAFINYLNSTSYGGTNQWRLPGMTDTGAAGCDFGNSGTDCGYNVDPASSDLARLYYSELNLMAKFDTDGGSNSGSGYGIFGNDGAPGSGPVEDFINVESNSYWLGLEYGPNPQTAWAFATSEGYQGFESKEGFGYAWAVTSGPVSPIPLPAPLWLIGTGLLCLAGKLRGKRQA
jgi:hypothetical protein